MRETTTTNAQNKSDAQSVLLPRGVVGIRIPNGSLLETYAVLPQWINLPDRAHRPELVSFRDGDGATVYTGTCTGETVPTDAYCCPDLNAFVISPHFRGKARFGALCLNDFLQPEKTTVMVSVNLSHRGQGPRFEDYLRVPISALLEAKGPVEQGLFLEEQNRTQVIPLAKLPNQESVYAAIAAPVCFTEREVRLLATDTRPFSDAYKIELLVAK